jgi:hypothetical protein
MSTQQDHEYNSALNNIFFPKSHQLKRTNWLWRSFEAVHIPEELKFHCGDKDSDNEMEIQRDLVRFYSRPLWNKWRYWKRHLIDFQNQVVAPELAFYKDYPKPLIRKSYWTPGIKYLASGAVSSGFIHGPYTFSSGAVTSGMISSGSYATCTYGNVISGMVSTNWIPRS